MIAYCDDPSLNAKQILIQQYFSKQVNVINKQFFRMDFLVEYLIN